VAGAIRDVTGVNPAYSDVIVVNSGGRFTITVPVAPAAVGVAIVEVTGVEPV
jgi:hypothetical protein